MAPKKPRRGWLQFGMRTVFVLTLAVGIFFGFCRGLIDPYFRQHQALEALKNHQVALATKYTLPKRLKFLERIDPLGAKRYEEVVHLDMTNGDFAAKHIKLLTGMRRLQSLIVRGPEFQDEHLQALLRLPDLEVVVLDTTSVTLEEVASQRKAHPNTRIRISQRVYFEEQLARQSKWQRTRATLLFQQRLSRLPPPGTSTLNSLPFQFHFGGGESSCYVQRRAEPLTFWADKHDAGLDLGLQHWLDPYQITLVSPDDATVTELPTSPTAQSLVVSRSRLSAAGLKQLAKMPNLTRLQFKGSIRRPELSELASLKSLAQLEITNNNLTDKSLMHLRELTSLRSLNLTGNRIRGIGLPHLRHLPIETLKLNKTAVDEEGMAALAHLSTLLELELADTRLDSASISYLQHLPRLRKLTLRNTLIDDAAMAHLAELTSLRSLSLQNTSITDTNLMLLQGLSNLRFLHLGLTEVSSEKVHELVERLPQCRVVR